jgi:hypothetical protein
VQKSLPLKAANRLQYAVVGIGLLVLLSCLPVVWLVPLMGAITVLHVVRARWRRGSLVPTASRIDLG